MCKKNNVTVHDPIRETEEKIQKIFSECRGIPLTLQTLLGIMIICCSFLVICIDSNCRIFDGKISTHLFIAIVCSVLSLIYVIILNRNISKPYIKRFGIKPDNESLFYLFAVKCQEEGISDSQLDICMDLLDIKTKHESFGNFFFSPILSCIISIIITNTEKVFHLNPNIELQQGVTAVLEAVLVFCIAMSIYFLIVNLRKPIISFFKRLDGFERKYFQSMRDSFIGGGGCKVGANFSFSDQMHGYVHLERRSGGERSP